MTLIERIPLLHKNSAYFKGNSSNDNKKQRRFIREKIRFLKSHKQNYPINCFLLYHYGIFDIWEHKKRKIDEKLMTNELEMKEITTFSVIEYKHEMKNTRLFLLCNVLCFPLEYELQIMLNMS